MAKRTVAPAAKGEVANPHENSEANIAPATDTNNQAAAGEGDAAPAAEVKAPGKIAQIIELFKAGKTNKEIQELGFHPTTISIQVSKYKKAHPDLYPPKPPAPTKAEKKAAAAKAKEIEGSVVASDDGAEAAGAKADEVKSE